MSINPDALQVGSEFWQMQPPQRRIADGVTYCDRNDVVDAVESVRAHEGMSRSDANSHVQVHMDAFEREAGPRTETIVALDPNLNAIRNEIDDIARDESIRITHAPGTNPYQSDCRFNYSTIRAFP